MDKYCYKCRMGVKEEVCEECNCVALPVVPRDAVPGTSGPRTRGEVGIALLPSELGSLDKVYSCRLQLRLPEEWGRRDLREVGACTDLFMNYRQCEMSWRYDADSGRLRLLGKRSDGRCEWCRAFRKNLQNMAREEGRPFLNDGACPIV